ncbi:MAG: hypothetical protein HYZ14_12340 [Bacteroidetes bacterium]|nr:hypothetical protein [Bacteroidota bacterium]
MKYWIVVIALGLVTSSCLKKIEGVDTLNTNIFDKEYAGDCWFYIDDAYSYYNDFGFPRVMIKAVLPEENAPGLQSYLIYITCRVNNQQEVLFNSYLNTSGDYTFFYDAAPETSNEYCLEAGIYLQDEDTTINRFTLCTQP